MVVGSASFIGVGMLAAILPMMSVERGSQMVFVLQSCLLLVSGVYYPTDHPARLDAAPVAHLAGHLRPRRGPQGADRRRVRSSSCCPTCGRCWSWPSSSSRSGCGASVGPSATPSGPASSRGLASMAFHRRHRRNGSRRSRTPANALRRAGGMGLGRALGGRLRAVRRPAACGRPGSSPSIAALWLVCRRARRGRGLADRQAASRRRRRRPTRRRRLGGLPRVAAPRASCASTPTLPRRSAFRRRAAGLAAGRPDRRRQRGHALRRHVAQRRPQPAPPRALRGDGPGVGRGAGRAPHQGRSRRRRAETRAARLADELRVSVVALSARTGQGVEAVARWFVPGRTLALVGSSGVGKSTLLNRLAGEQLMVTREIREDDSRGRHTTTHRELFLPARRRADAGHARHARAGAVGRGRRGRRNLRRDLVELASRCRFADCSHRLEPGCAVRRPSAAGRLDQARLKSYRRLSHELAEQPTSVAARREKDRRFAKMVRKVAAESMSRKTYRGRDY